MSGVCACLNSDRDEEWQINITKSWDLRSCPLQSGSSANITGYILQYNDTYHHYTIHCSYSTKDCYCTVEPNSHHHNCPVPLVTKVIETATIQIAAVSSSGVGPFSDPLIIANQGISILTY